MIRRLHNRAPATVSKKTSNVTPLRALVLSLAVGLALAAAAASPATASAAPVLKLTSLANTSVAPGQNTAFVLDVKNIGDQATSGDLQLQVDLPPGFTAVEVTNTFPEFGFVAWTCPGIAGNTHFTCESSSVLLLGPSQGGTNNLRLVVHADPSASGYLTTAFRLTELAAASPPVSTVEVTRVTSDAPALGFDSLDAGLFDSAGDTFTQAGAVPDSAATVTDFVTHTDPAFLLGEFTPVEATRDVFVDLPPGLLGNPLAVPRCELSDLSVTKSPVKCDPATQIGIIEVRFNSGGAIDHKTFPVFNMAPGPGMAARFGVVVLSNPVLLAARLHGGDDYGVSVRAERIPQGISPAGSTVTLWGVPASESHRLQRACPGQLPPEGSESETCPAGLPEHLPFIRNVTACTKPGEGLLVTAQLDSWQHPGDFVHATVVSHQAPGYPLSPVPSLYPAGYSGPTAWGEQAGPDGCDAVPFTPDVSVKPTTDQADSPSGLDFELTVPQDSWSDADAISQADLKRAVVTLPEGMSVNPASAAGLGACTTEQIGLRGTSFPAPAPIRFTGGPANCPESSKIGKVEIDSPVVDHTIEGSVYLAAQSDNPFDSLLALYITAYDPPTGAVLKLAGHVKAGEDGLLTTTFDNQPQLPFESLRLQLFGGPRGALRTPPTCGTHTAEVVFSPWSGNAPVALSSSFQIAKGPGGAPCPNGGFDPKLSAGVQSPIGGAYSPFHLRLTREDGTRELSGISLDVPKGLLANLKGIPYCPESALGGVSGAEGTAAAQLASPACPAASQVGRVTVGAGAGPSPFFVETGRVYWTGPYKGAPVSLAVLAPALAGPFDLGNVLVRTRFEVDPETAQITAISDPLPTSLHGIPLDLRDVRVSLDRPNYTLNPTSCDPMAFEADISGVGGASAHRSEHFQVAECGRLAFKPRLSLRLKGGTGRGDYPALRATVRMPAGGANIAKASVALPHSEFLAQSHIRTICTRVQYAADSCPKGSIYGYARAYSPILDYYLQGPVYLRSSSHPLPDLVVSLGGQVQVDIVGRIDSKNGGIRTTFATVPDAPVSKFVLTMQGGKKGLLENSRDICKHPNRATALFDGQNGKTHDVRPVLKADCGGKKGKRR